MLRDPLEAMAVDTGEDKAGTGWVGGVETLQEPVREWDMHTSQRSLIPRLLGLLSSLVVALCDHQAGGSLGRG